jgi:tight adherence protein B
MRRRALILTFLGTAALAAAVAASGATGKAVVTEAAGTGTGFPARSYVLTLPHGMELKPGAVRLFENGARVEGLTVTPVGESKAKQFGVVLAIDASISMRGKPIAGAMAAARALALQRRPNQLLGVVTFNNAVTSVLPLTDDQQAIDAALSKTPALAQGTRLYDGVDAAVAMLEDRNVAVGSVVVLSDGADLGSQITETAAAAHARNARVGVYSVGLQSRFFDRAALKGLARDASGTFILAKSVESLTKIYEQLGSRFASEYLLSYRSLAGPNVHVKVGVVVDGLDGVARTGYDTPALAVVKRGPAAPYKPSALNRFLTSALTMTIVGMIAAGLIGAGASAALSGPRAGTVRKRMAEFVSVPVARETSRRPTAQLTERMLEGTDTMLRGSSLWKRWGWELEIAKVTMPPEQIAVLTAIGSLLVFLLINVVFGSLLVAIVLAGAIPLAVRSLLKRKLATQRKMFAEQLPDNLQVLASALRAGHSFIGALSVVVNDAPEPARSEFQRVVADEQLGVPIDQALHVVVERMESRELEQVALVAALQRETGGNTAEVLDQVTDTIRERFELRRTVQTLTAQGRMSRWVLTLLPLFLLIVITLINPSYMDVLYDSTSGRVLLVLAGVFVVAGSLVIKRIVNIKV